MRERTVAERLTRYLLWPVAVVVTVVIGVSFILSFNSQSEIAISARIPEAVAWGLPVILDGSILVGTFAALIFQASGWRRSWYPWLVMLIFGAFSVWSNGMHATGATLGTAEVFVVGSVAPVGLFLTTHLLALLISHHHQSKAAPDADAGPAATLDTVNVETVALTTDVAPRVVAPRAEPRSEPARPAAAAAALKPVAVKPVTAPAAPKTKAVTAARPAAPAALTRQEIADRHATGEVFTAPLIAELMRVSESRAAVILAQL